VEVEAVGAGAGFGVALSDLTGVADEVGAGEDVDLGEALADAEGDGDGDAETALSLERDSSSNLFSSTKRGPFSAASRYSLAVSS
jgi:hypothetical protein